MIQKRAKENQQLAGGDKKALLTNSTKAVNPSEAVPVKSAKPMNTRKELAKIARIGQIPL